MKLPRINGKEAVKAFLKAGWTISRCNGSHIILSKTECTVKLSVPMKLELKRGMLKQLLTKSGLSIEQFANLL